MHPALLLSLLFAHNYTHKETPGPFSKLCVEGNSRSSEPELKEGFQQCPRPGISLSTANCSPKLLSGKIPEINIS